MPPSIPPAKGSDPEDVAWALQTADALWRRSERTDALVWLRRAVQAAGEADDPERAFALADAAAELTEQLETMPEAAPVVIASAPPPRLAPDASGSIEVSLEVDEPASVGRTSTSFPPGAGAEIDDLLGGEEPASVREAPEPPASSEAPVLAAPSPVPSSAVPLPPPTPPPRVAAAEPPPKPSGPRPPPLPPRKKKLPAARLPPPPSSPEPLSLSDPEVIVVGEASPPSSSAAPSRPIPLPRGALFEDSTPFLPSSDSEETEAVSISSRSGEHLAEGFDTLVRRSSSSALRAAPAIAPASEPPRAAASEPPGAAASEPPGAAASEPPGAAASEPDAAVEDEPQHQFTVPAPPQFTEPPPEARELGRLRSEPAPPSAGPPISLEAEAFADLPDETRDTFAAAGTVHDLSRDEEVPAVALCYVLEGEVRVSSAVVDAAGLILKRGEVLRARGTIEANLPLRLSAHSEHAKVATWGAHSVEDAFASCPWVEDDLRTTANRTLAICGATIGPLGERLDENIFLDAISRFEVMVLLPGEVFIEKGAPLPGLCIVGVGEVSGNSSHGPGDFVFPEGVLTLAPSPVTFQAGSEGALILTASRAAAQELLVTCPPLLEILAGM